MKAVPRETQTTVEPELLERVHAIMARPYRFVLTPLPADDGGGYFIEVPDLPGCWSDGTTPAEAYEHVQEAMEVWLASALDAGEAIPEPEPTEATSEKSYSGKFLTRVPRSVHRQLSHRAQVEAVSVNQLVLSYIAAGLGRDQMGGGITFMDLDSGLKIGDSRGSPGS